MKKKVLTMLSLGVLAVAIIGSIGQNWVRADFDCDTCCLKCTGGCVCDSKEPDGCRCK